MNTKFEFNYLGEFRMGCDGYGISIINDNITIDILKSEHIFIGKKPEAKEPAITVSTDGRYYLLTGDFFTYVFDSSNNSLSLYKATIRDSSGIWCEETPILGDKTYHINGKNNQHYYVQFPFFNYKSFKEEWAAYHSRRVKQIKELKNG